MKVSSSNRGSVSTPVVAALVVFLVITAFLIFYYNGRKPDNKRNANSSTSITNNTSDDVLQYRSTTLGVSFNYVGQDNGKRILIKEIDDTIYVYPDGTEPEQGQFVRVWSKGQDVTLENALRKVFLTGYDPKKCYVTSGIDSLGTKPASGIAAVINFPAPSDTSSPWWVNGDKCPAGYSLSNGLAYFWTDVQTAAKFVYFSIGQYSIPSGANQASWHSTLEFLR